MEIRLLGEPFGTRDIYGNVKHPDRPYSGKVVAGYDSPTYEVHYLEDFKIPVDYDPKVLPDIQMDIRREKWERTDKFDEEGRMIYSYRPKIRTSYGN